MTVRVSDANVLAWRDLDFEDGSGRGSPEDWLASGCWPDAVDAPMLAVVGDDAYYAHRGTTRRLPPFPDAPSDGVWLAADHVINRVWPDMWLACIDPRWTLRAAVSVMPLDKASQLLCAFARTTTRFIPSDETRPESALAAAERFIAGTGSHDDFVSASRGARVAARSVEPESAQDNACLAIVSAITSVSSRECELFADAVARYVVQAFEQGTPRNTDCHRLTSYLLRLVLPWHVVLACLLRAPAG